MAPCLRTVNAGGGGGLAPNLRPERGKTTLAARDIWSRKVGEVTISDYYGCDSGRNSGRGLKA